METLGYILAALSFINVWTRDIYYNLLTEKAYDNLGKEVGRRYKSKRHKKLDVKPFNCGLCLSFWAGVVLFILTLDVIFLSLPLWHKLINKVI